MCYIKLSVGINHLNKNKLKVNIKGGKMRKVVYFLSIIFFLMGGCTKILVKKESMKTPYKTFKGVVDVDITMEKQSKKGAQVAKEMALRAQKQGVIDVARKWLNQSTMFKVGESKKQISGKTVVLNSIDTNFNPIYDDVTGIYEAKFKCFIELDPINYLSGIITGIEGGYSIATSHIAIKFFHFTPEENTYFVIAKKNEFGVKDYYQIVGIGRIYNNVDMISQGEILTSNRSIKTRDMVFLLKTKIIPIVEKKLESSDKNQMPIVKVHPVLEKEESGPKEMK